MPKKSKPPANRRSNATDGASTKKTPRKFKDIRKRRDPIAESEAADTHPTKAASATKKSFEQGLIESVNASGSPELSAKYAALCGAARPVAKPLVCDRGLMKAVELDIGRDLQSLLAESPSDVGLQTTRIGVVSGAHAVISVMEMRKAKALYEKAKVDGIATVRFCAIPGADPAWPDIALDLVTTIWGTDAESKLASAASRSRGPDSYQRSRTDWDEPDEIDWDMALGGMFSPPFHSLPQWDPLRDRTAEFDRRCDTGKRAAITLMCRSQLPLRKALLGFGGGKRIVKRALANVDESLKARCKAGPAILDENEIPHFWFSELRRQGWDNISVPIVKLH